MRFDKGILQDVERPLLPKLSYLIMKYANDDEIAAVSKMTGGNNQQSRARMTGEQTSPSIGAAGEEQSQSR